MPPLRGEAEVYVGGKAPQLPWELPGKPALFTSGSVTGIPGGNATRPTKLSG